MKTQELDQAIKDGKLKPTTWCVLEGPEVAFLAFQYNWKEPPVYVFVLSNHFRDCIAKDILFIAPDLAAAEHACECWEKVGKWFVFCSGSAVLGHIVAYDPQRNRLTVENTNGGKFDFLPESFSCDFFDTHEEVEAALKAQQEPKCKECEGTGKLPGPGADNPMVDCPWCEGGGDAPKEETDAEKVNQAVKAEKERVIAIIKNATGATPYEMIENMRRRIEEGK